MKHDWKQNQTKNKQTQIDPNNSKRIQSVQLSKIKRKNYNTYDNCFYCIDKQYLCTLEEEDKKVINCNKKAGGIARKW